MYNVYVLGNYEFLENCNKYIKDKRLTLSTTTDVELFKNQITKTKNDNFFIVIDSDKIGNYNKKMILFGKRLITYKWLEKSELNPDSFISFDLTKYSDIERKILNIIERREDIKEIKVENELIRQEKPIEEDTEEDLDFDIDNLIDEANNAEVTSDFDKNEVEEAVEKVVDSHSASINMQDVAVSKKSEAKTTEFSAKKLDIRGPDIDSDDDKVSDDDIEALMKQYANTEKDTPKPEKQNIKKNTVAQNLVETLGEDKAFEMFEAGEL